MCHRNTQEKVFFTDGQKRPTIRAADLVVGHANKQSTSEKLFSVSTLGSPTKPLTKLLAGFLQNKVRKKTLVISAVVCIILAACGRQTEPATIIPSITLEPSSTPGFIPTKTPRPTLHPLPTLTPLPSYPTKSVLFEYQLIGDHSVYDILFDNGPSWSSLVLYSDGQMIIPGKKYQQKILSPNEIKTFLRQLEMLGFYSLESNQKHNPTDKLYNYENNYQKSFDGRLYCITVNASTSRNLCAYEPDKQFLVPQMKNILQYLDEYRPEGTTPYFPDRLLLWVRPGRDPYEENLPATTIPWAEHLPPLSARDPITYVDGDAAKEIYMLFDSTNQGKVFGQNGKEYTVYFHVVLPHDQVTNADR